MRSLNDAADSHDIEWNSASWCVMRTTVRRMYYGASCVQSLCVMRTMVRHVMHDPTATQ